MNIEEIEKDERKICNNNDAIQQGKSLQVKFYLSMQLKSRFTKLLSYV